jgi:hypothetical protein
MPFFSLFCTSIIFFIRLTDDHHLSYITKLRNKHSSSTSKKRSLLFAILEPVINGKSYYVRSCLFTREGEDTGRSGSPSDSISTIDGKTGGALLFLQLDWPSPILLPYPTTPLGPLYTRSQGWNFKKPFNLPQVTNKC